MIDTEGLPAAVRDTVRIGAKELHVAREYARLRDEEERRHDEKLWTELWTPLVETVQEYVRSDLHGFLLFQEGECRARTKRTGVPGYSLFECMVQLVCPGCDPVHLPFKTETRGDGSVVWRNHDGYLVASACGAKRGYPKLSVALAIARETWLEAREREASEAAEAERVRADHLGTEPPPFKSPKPTPPSPEIFSRSSVVGS